MGDKENLKKMRSDAKRVNTLAMRKFDGLMHVGSSDESLKKQAEIVEKSYDELLSACIDYSEIVGDGEDEEMYMKANTEEYYRLMSTYNNLMKASKEIENKKRTTWTGFRRNGRISKAIKEIQFKDQVARTRTRQLLKGQKLSDRD